MSDYTDLVPARKMILLAEQMKLLPARTVCECGVGPYFESIAPSFKGKCEKLLLIEPQPFYAYEAERDLGMIVHRVAVSDKPGRAVMVKNRINGGAAFLKETWCPLFDEGEEFEVEVVTFDCLDDGQIDIFNLDCEGQEWAVIQKMSSRPKLFCIEIHPENPNRDNIRAWLSDQGYTEVCHTGPGNNTVTYAK